MGWDKVRLCGCPVGVEHARLTQKKNPPSYEGLEIDEDDHQGKCGESEQHGASTTTILIQTAHNPGSKETA